jgi:Type I restriction modification DNA specificity domain
VVSNGGGLEMKVTKLNLPVMSSWIEGNERRLDGNPYLSGAFEARFILEKLSAKKQPLQTITKGGIKGIFNGPRFSRSYVNDPDYGVPFLSGADMLQADLSYLPLISKKQVSTMPQMILEEGTILISSYGTIGRTMYCRSDMAGMVGSDNVLKIIPDQNKALPGYIFAFLSSRFGIPLVISGTSGAIITFLDPSRVANLPVPRLGKDIEEKAHQKITEAAKLRTEYQAQVKEATQRLFSSVGLKDITAYEWHKLDADLGFVHKLSSHSSLRAVNFNPRFKQLCETIKSAKYKELHEICKPGTLRRAGRYKRIDADSEFSCQLIGQRQLFWIRPEGRWVAKSVLGDDIFVEPGTILVAARGTLGESELYCRSEFIWGEAVSMAFSEDLLRVIADEAIMPRGCLFAFMRSETAFRMLRSCSMGSKLQDHHPDFLPHLPVPYPNKETQQEIHELVIDAYEKRHRSNILEDEAVKIVDNAIEEGANG